MRFKADRCAHCGGPPLVFTSELGLLPGGKTPVDDFFFCSDDCYLNELNRYMPDELAFGKTIGDDKQYKFLLKDYRDARERCYPKGRLYSNEEKIEIEQFDREEQELITQYKNDWAARRDKAIKNAVGRVHETWNAHFAQEWKQEEEERLIEEQRQRDLYRSFGDVSLPDETRFSGMWCIAPPGRGKTTLLHTMFLDDIQKNASIIVMDSKGDLINPIKSMAAIADRLILIEPDSKHPLALNPLDVPAESIQHTIALIEYILSGLLEAKFTNLQSALFRHVLPAIMQAVHNPTLEDLKRVLANGLTPAETFKLDERLRRFFEDRASGFYSKTYAETRSQIIWRLDFILTNDTMRAMFDSPITRLKIADAMNSGKIILIDASKAILGDDGSEFYQRFFLALILAAAQQRSKLKPADKLPVYVYLDECQWVRNDQKLATILDECRSQKIALILAHQRTDQILNPNVLSAMSNCAIRFANSDDEAKFLAPKLRCEPEFLHSLPRGTFAAFVRDLTPHAVALKVPYTDIEALPRMSSEQQTAIRERMRAEYGFAPQPAPLPPPTLPAQSAPAVDTHQPSSTNAPAPPEKLQSGSDSPEAGSTW